MASRVDAHRSGRERAGDGVAAAEAGGDVGGAECEQFAVGVDGRRAVVCVVRPLEGAEALRVAEDDDREGAGGEVDDLIEVDTRETEALRSRAGVAHHRHAGPYQVEQPHEDD